jgi:hypothetical protein
MASPPITAAAWGGSGSAAVVKRKVKACLPEAIEASSSKQKRWCIVLPKDTPGQRMKNTTRSVMQSR